MSRYFPTDPNLRHKVFKNPARSMERLLDVYSVVYVQKVRFLVWLWRSNIYAVSFFLILFPSLSKQSGTHNDESNCDALFTLIYNEVLVEQSQDRVSSIYVFFSSSLLSVVCGNTCVSNATVCPMSSPSDICGIELIKWLIEVYVVEKNRSSWPKHNYSSGVLWCIRRTCACIIIKFFNTLVCTQKPRKRIIYVDKLLIFDCFINYPLMISIIRKFSSRFFSFRLHLVVWDSIKKKCLTTTDDFNPIKICGGILLLLNELN